MRIISRHLLGQLLGAALLCSLLLSALVFLLQALRLGHHLAGGEAGLLLLGRALLLSAPSLLAFSLPLGSAAAVLLVWSRLADTRQLLALQLAGASPWQLAAPPLQQLLLCAVLGLGLGAGLEGRSLARLQAVLAGEASQALLATLRPGQFRSLSPELQLYLEERRPAATGETRVEGLFVALARPPQQLLARQATLRAGAGASLELELHGGELRSVGGTSGLEKVGFQRASLRFDLWPALQPHLGFLARRAAEAPSRALLGAASGVSLGLIMLLVGWTAASVWARGLLALLGLALQQGGLMLVTALGGGVPGGLAWSALLAALLLLALGRITSPG